MKAQKHLGQSLSMVVLFAVACIGMVSLIAFQSGSF